ncbi:MAG: hypothetical protein B7X04_03885 [Parcubacteria group bacterium 21-54-25]|nr:MAG: hypothetical protein B7X04_03885 [Parcubacteria group bacterium 21-54-25]HQU08182.1 hypothetical protein [Candidatus Paceibacterota bacterium]
MNLAAAWASFDVRIAALIFVAYAAVDALYAYYTLQVVQRRPYTAATAGAFMYFLLAIGVLSYVHNILYLIPLAAGSWVGTFFVVRRGTATADNSITP